MVKLNKFIDILIYHITEGRRHGKTVIFAKNIKESGNNDDDGSDSNYDDDDCESDNSMNETHPIKKQKIS